MSQSAGQSADQPPSAPGPHAALLAEAATKSGLVWVRPAGQRRAWPAWHVWHDGAVVVVSGPGEQDLPVLEGPVELVLRSKASGARLLTVPATASTLAPDDERWPGAARALAASRLNATTSPAQLPDRWREANPITRLTATGAALEAPGADGDRSYGAHGYDDHSYDDHSGAAPPAPTPATTSGWRPWHARGRSRRPRRP